MKIAAKYNSRAQAAKKIANALGYSIKEGKAFEDLEAFADAIQLPCCGQVPEALRQRAEDYLEPPLQDEPTNMLVLG